MGLGALPADEKTPSALSFSEHFLIITLSRCAEPEGSGDGGVTGEGGWASLQSQRPNWLYRPAETGIVPVKSRIWLLDRKSPSRSGPLAFL